MVLMVFSFDCFRCGCGGAFPLIQKTLFRTRGNGFSLCMKYAGGKLIYRQIKCYIFTGTKVAFRSSCPGKFPSMVLTPLPSTLPGAEILWASVTSGSSQ